MIVDAGPALNFFSIHQERILIGLFGTLSAPDTVRHEIENKADRDQRFSHAPAVLKKLINSRRFRVLSDQATEELIRAVEIVAGQTFEKRSSYGKDLGETMAIAHATLIAEAGQEVTLLIDDGDGRLKAERAAKRLDRKRKRIPETGKIIILSTCDVLELAANSQHIADKQTMRNLYSRLKPLDDGLPPPIEATNLLSRELGDRL